MTTQQQIELYVSVSQLNEHTCMVPDHNGVYELGVLEYGDVADDKVTLTSKND